MAIVSRVVCNRQAFSRNSALRGCEEGETRRQQAIHRITRNHSIQQSQPRTRLRHLMAVLTAQEGSKSHRLRWRRRAAETSK
jgi:hypothetical protein